jgi:hypothetical protein
VFLAGDEMSKKIVAGVRDYPGRLYVVIPQEIIDDADLEPGDRLVCVFEKILDPEGKPRVKVGKEVTWEVGEFPHMLVVPRSVSEKYEIVPGGHYEEGDKLELTIEKVKKNEGSSIAV